MTTGLSTRIRRLSLFVLVLCSVLIAEKSLEGQTSTATEIG